jgi:hypothetical protein
VPLTTDAIKESSDDRSTLIQESERILQSPTVNQQYVQYCQDILHNTLPPERSKLTLCKLSAFVAAYEVSHFHRSLSYSTRKMRMFDTFPDDEVYRFVRSVLTFLRNEREPQLEVTDLTLAHR